MDKLITEDLIVQKSGIHGLGCFTLSLIPTGNMIIEYAGEIIDYQEACRRNSQSSKRRSEYILKVSENVFIDGYPSGNSSRFINHSCNPNCRVLRKGNRAFIVARRKIFPGEELTIDYDFDIEFRETCYCGSSNCRGYI